MAHTNALLEIESRLNVILDALEHRQYDGADARRDNGFGTTILIEALHAVRNCATSALAVENRLTRALERAAADYTRETEGSER